MVWREGVSSPGPNEKDVMESPTAFGRDLVPDWLARGYWAVNDLNYAYEGYPTEKWFGGVPVRTYDLLPDGSDEPLLQSLHLDSDSRDVIYDVGANRGAYALSLGARLSDGAIYAFEPNPRVYTFLRKNVLANSPRAQLRCFELALGAKEGEAVLYDSLEPTLGSLEQGHSVRFGVEVIEEVSVEVTTLDTLVFDRGFPPPSKIKVDVEGHEVDVVSGGQRLVHRHSPTWYIELHDEDTGSEIEAILGENYTAEHFGRWAVYKPKGSLQTSSST